VICTRSWNKKICNGDNRLRQIGLNMEIETLSIYMPMLINGRWQIRQTKLWMKLAICGNHMKIFVRLLFSTIKSCFLRRLEEVWKNAFSHAEKSHRSHEFPTIEGIYGGRNQWSADANAAFKIKAPGPDGFAACFYQENWATVGTEVCNTILGILNSGSINNELNSTYIALVPKVKNPCKVSAFRLISLCNVLYKIASKVLANRLKEVIPNVISYISRVLLFLGVLFLITFWWLMKHFILYKLGCGVRMAIWH